MRNLILLIVCFITAAFYKSQLPPIMVCNAAGNSCAPYTTLDDAYTNANSGDYIYLPGGTFTLTKNIDKEIHVYGAGFDTNGTPTTGITSISGNINMVDGSNNSSFEGFYLTGNFGNSFNNPNDPNPYESKNILVKSCNINAFIGKFSFSKIINCVTRSWSNFFYGNNDEIRNSVFDTIYNLNIAIIKNNIIQGNWYGNGVSIVRVDNSNIANNIISLGGCSRPNVNPTCTNNLEDGFSYYTTGNYSYGTSDWHVLLDSPAHNGGDDGTDIGIYGGSTPWKEGAIPSNPHIFYKSVGNTTDNNGNLQVQIKVSAQN